MRETLELMIRMRNDAAVNGDFLGATDLDQEIRDRFGICPDCLLRAHGTTPCLQAV